ncbi:MAG: YraN family protein [Parcubacteria group bacterium]
MKNCQLNRLQQQRNNQCFKIIERNFKRKYAEVDLAGTKNNELVIFEVRTKRGEMFGSPEDTFNRKKLGKIWLGARILASAKKWQGLLRIDAVCVVLKEDNNVLRINHYENII